MTEKPKAEPTAEERIARASRVLSMLNGAQSQVDILGVIAKVDAIAALLVEQHQVTAEDLERRILIARAEFLESVIGIVQAERRGDEDLERGGVSREMS